jgi:hypothetical protein
MKNEQTIVVGSILSAAAKVTAPSLGISEPAARRQWAFARAWLYREIKAHRD